MRGPERNQCSKLKVKLDYIQRVQPHGAPAREEGRARPGALPPEDRQGLPDGRGDARRLRAARPEVGGVGARPTVLLDDVLERPGDEGGRGDAPQGAGGHPRLVAEVLDERNPGGAQLDRPVHQAGSEGLQEHRVLRDDDIPQARAPGLLGTAGSIIRYPPETAKSQKRHGAQARH